MEQNPESTALPIRKPSKITFGEFLSSRSLGFQATIIVICLALVLGGGWLIIRVSRLQRQLDILVAEQFSSLKDKQNLSRELSLQLTRRFETEKELAKLKEGSQSSDVSLPPQPTIVAFTLIPGLVRDAEHMQRIVVPSGTDLVRFDLDLGANVQTSFDAAVQTPDGAEIWRSEDLRPAVKNARNSLILRLPGQLLRPGNYALRLLARGSGGTGENIPTYLFRVTDK